MNLEIQILLYKKKRKKKQLTEVEQLFMALEKAL